MNTKTVDQERDAFEKWYSYGSNSLRAIERSGDIYKYMPANVAWQVWQARAALDTAPQKPAPFGVNLKMVPFDPTAEMVEAARLKYPLSFDEMKFAEDWRYFVKAAPANYEGYQWVPIEPTPEMLKAVKWEEDAFGGKSAWPSDIYKAMLAAARNPETKQG